MCERGLQVMIRCSVVSRWAKYSLQEGSPPCSLAIISPVKRSQQRSFRCDLSLRESLVVSTPCRATCGRPERPVVCTLRNLIFELFMAWSLSSFSWCTLTLVCTMVRQPSLVKAAGCCMIRSGSGVLYILDNSLTWADQVVSLVFNLFFFLL